MGVALAQDETKNQNRSRYKSSPLGLPFQTRRSSIL